ncbi:hypothetical protein [Shewanella algae]|uniref:hypothetical protein n=1 Tax=Shewanella algae TaxID=38313 RepID=UPI0031F5CB93
MNVFKLSVIATDVHMIRTRENFKSLTDSISPWVSEVDGNFSYYAVCPHCTNSVEIVHWKTTNTDFPYARHYLKQVIGLGNFNFSAYEQCPYRNRNNITKPSKDNFRPEGHPVNQGILTLLIKYFDCAVFLLEHALQLRFTPECLLQMLIDFRDAHGWRYMGASMQNIPWIFTCFTLPKSLNNLRLNNEMLKVSLLKSKPDLIFNEHGRIEMVQGDFFNPVFDFYGHTQHIRNGHLTESIIFRVSNKYVVLHEQCIEFDPLKFIKLIKIDDFHLKNIRRAELVDLAHRVFNGVVDQIIS